MSVHRVMQMAGLLLGMVALLAPLLGLAHEVQGGHDELAVAANDNGAWERQLAAFHKTGRAHSLAAAKRIADSRALDIDINTLYLLARTAQADHRFSEAIGYLQRLLLQRADHTPALLLLATIESARGRSKNAQRACNQLRSVALVTLVACKAQAQTEADHRTLRMLEGSLTNASPKPENGVMLAWVLATIADQAAQLGEHGLALDYYRRAQRMSPSVRVVGAMVDRLLALEQPRAALAILPPTPEALSLQVKQLVVLRSLGRLRQGDQRVDRLDELFAKDQRSLDFTHGREMAEFYLDVLEDAPRALAVIDRYVVIQQEFEDLQFRARALDLDGKIGNG